MGNGQKLELPVLFGQKRMYPENNSGRECCWPYLIGQHPLSPVFDQKRPGAPGNSYFAQLPPVFGHFMFLSGGLLDYLMNRSTSATRNVQYTEVLYLQPLIPPKRFDIFSPITGGCSEGLGAFWFFFKQLTAKFCPGDVEVDNFFSFFCKQFWGNQLYPCLSGGYSRSFITPARTTKRTSTEDREQEMHRLPSQSPVAWTEGVTADLCNGH